MTVRPASDGNTVPLGVAVLGVLVVGTGWLVFQGLPFLVGCALTVAFARGRDRPADDAPEQPLTLPGARVAPRPYTRPWPC